MAPKGEGKAAKGGVKKAAAGKEKKVKDPNAPKARIIQVQHSAPVLLHPHSCGGPLAWLHIYCDCLISSQHDRGFTDYHLAVEDLTFTLSLKTTQKPKSAYFFFMDEARPKVRPHSPKTQRQLFFAEG